MRSKCSNRRRALSTNYSSCSARCAARARRTHGRIVPLEYVRTYESSRLRRGDGGGCSNSSAHSENRVSRLRLVERPRRLVSYATIDLAGLDTPFPPARSLRALYSERPVGAGNGRNGFEKEKSHERGGERRRRTVARVATSIRFSSSCGEVVKTFLLPPGAGVVTRTARSESSSVIIICLHC